MTREITHMKAFAAALESLGKPAFSIVQIAPTPKLVNQYFNDSTDEGEHGEIDARGPWNDGADWEFVEAPAFQIAGDLVPNGEVHIDQLQELFDTHLAETQEQVERLNDCFGLLGVQARAKPCKGMQGIVEEGEEVIGDYRKKDDASADLALIASAQKLEHMRCRVMQPQRIWRRSCVRTRLRDFSPSRWQKKPTLTSCSTRSRKP